MKYTRLKFSKEASDRLGQLKGRTGITPNILARIGFVMSLNEPTLPNLEDYPSDSEREIDRQVLTGQWDLLFITLLKERCCRDGIDTNDEDLLFSQFRSHMNRGVILLHKRLRSLSDLGVLLSR